MPARHDGGHLVVASEVSVGRTEGFLRSFARVGAQRTSLGHGLTPLRFASCETGRAVGGRAAATDRLGALVSRETQEPVLARFWPIPTAPSSNGATSLASSGALLRHECAVNQWATGVWRLGGCAIKRPRPVDEADTCLHEPAALLRPPSPARDAAASGTAGVRGERRSYRSEHERTCLTRGRRESRNSPNLRLAVKLGWEARERP
jgi:hypothetical protein